MIHNVRIMYEHYNEESIANMIEYCEGTLGFRLGNGYKDIMENVNPLSADIYVGFEFYFETEEELVEFKLRFL